MSYSLVFHPAVREDVAALTKAVRERVRRAIETRLTVDPARWGRPLRGTLAGTWKLRVGDWRVVYAIRGDEVVVLAIKHRSMVYDEVRDRT